MDDQPVTRKRQPRRDAQRRREALLRAAASCFQEFGYDVPLEVVAERAGVGRGTLYRNFRDRDALALAIFSREIDRFEDTLDPAVSIEHNLAKMIRQGAPVQLLFRRITTDLQQSDFDVAAFQSLRQRLEELLVPAVRQACERGEIDARVTPADLVLVLRMVGGLLYPFMGEDEVTDVVNAALHLLLQGMRPR